MPLKLKKFIGKTAKIILFLLFGVLLLAVGVIMSLYSPWVQDTLRLKIIEVMNAKEGVDFKLDDLSVTFPLDVKVTGLSWVVDGDTLVAARDMEASVALWPLVAGRAHVSDIKALGVVYNMGNRDSLTALGIKADTILLPDAEVKFSGPDILLRRGRLGGGRVSLWINSDSVSPDTTVSEPSPMKIRLEELELSRFTYEMELLPTIDSLGCTVTYGMLKDGEINMAAQTVMLSQFRGSGLEAAYITPDSATLATVHPPQPPVKSTPSKPWTVKVGLIDFDSSSGLYTTRGYEPLPGLDFGYIQADNMTLVVRDFYNQAADLKLPLDLTGRERCGLDLEVKGTLAIDEEALRFEDFNIKTSESELAVSGLLGSGDMTADPGLPLALDASGHLGLGDVGLMFPFASPYVATFPEDAALEADISMAGTAGQIDIQKCDIRLEPSFALTADGSLTDVFSPSGMGGDVRFDGRVGRIGALKRLLLGKDSGLDIPPMRANGNMAMRSGRMTGDLQVVTDGGRMALKGFWQADAEAYSASLTARDFPVGAFMPAAGVGRVTATLDTKGRGYSPFRKSTSAEAKIDITSLTYDHHDYHGLTADITLHEGIAKIKAVSSDPAARAVVEATGNLDGDTYRWQMTADGNNIDLRALDLSADDALLSVRLDATVTATPGTEAYDIDAAIASFSLNREFSNIAFNNVRIKVLSTDSLTDARVTDRDFIASFVSPMGFKGLGEKFGDAMAVIDRQINRRTLSVDTLQKAMPAFDLDVKAGKNNFLNDILKPDKTGFSSVDICCRNDSVLALDSRLTGFNSGSLRLDTITFAVNQKDDHLRLDGAINNRPGTMDAWAKVKLGGFVSKNQIGLRLRQFNIKNETGFDIGLLGTVADSSLTVRFLPLYPIINYRPWTLNRSNFISYEFASGHIDANVRMSSDRSNVEIYTEHVGGFEGQEDLVVRLGNIVLSDWVAINPFLPPVKGELSADVRINRVDGAFNGKGYAQLTDFLYGKERVGNLRADFDVTTTMAGKLRATADLEVDGVKTMTLAGVLNDSTAGSPFALDFSMIRFPLRTLNPFLPSGTAKLSGMLNGQMKISGDSSAPILNGFLDFDSTAVKLGLTGASYPFSDVEIPVNNSVVSFDKFTIGGVNGNPLTIDGTVDIRSLASPVLDLNLNARNMQLVNTNKAAKGADIYGKAFIDLTGRVRGDMSLLRVNADLKLLPGTNVTYVIPDATNAIENRSKDDMVKFVNFADSGAVAQADSITQSGMAMLLEALLTIENGTTVNVDLSSDGKNRVSLQSSGTLDYSMTPVTDGRLSGRLNINGGFVRYSPPVISEKYFTFNNGSYIAFTGDMMNPMLNVSAVDVIKANVTKEGENSRLVNFDVTLSVTGTLRNMKVLFDLSTQDDITVQNELESMSPDQRQNQAINLMLYNIYSGPGTKGDASLGGNPLMSFLTSTANSWLANNIKGVDISLGVNQYDRTIDGSSSSTMSYSYQVSKSLFNDRFKIVVGGNYSTDANADENFSQNLINDISFEYFLNRPRTMYLRLFRKTGYESILEGEVTSTGVGFVYRHKMLHFRNLFGSGKSKDKDNSGTPDAAADSASKTVKTVELPQDSIPTQK